MSGRERRQKLLGGLVPLAKNIFTPAPNMLVNFGSSIHKNCNRKGTRAMRTSIITLAFVSGAFTISACSSDSNPNGTGETTGGNTQLSSGGTSNLASGGTGTSHTGGQTTSGGSVATSATSGGTGLTNTGGVGGSVGSTVTGGMASVGGSTNTGGLTNTGGVVSAGGTSGTGGIVATGGATGTSADAGTGGASDGGSTEPLTDEELRGKYLVTAVLNCGGCHTPSGGAFLSGSDCLFKSGTSGCLSSANLTNDDTGIRNLTDQQVKDAFTKGLDPNLTGSYLFANMPYYQYANLSDADADAIVAFLRTVAGVAHEAQANTAPFDIQPTAPEWAAVDPTELPNALVDAGTDNGKYLATLACVTCHTVEVTGANPRHIDALKAFQGGKTVTATVNGTSKTVQTSNLTPDASGLMNWTATQIATAITTDKDTTGTTICGMRALPNMTSSDATDIADYLLGIPAAVNAITQTCQ